MRETRCSRLVAYAVAVLATAVSLLLRWPLWPVLENKVPHMTCFPAVMIAAYFGGLWPGMLATILSALAANCILIKQPPYFHGTSEVDPICKTKKMPSLATPKERSSLPPRTSRPCPRAFFFAPSSLPKG